jgi:hypothetical protein
MQLPTKKVPEWHDVDAGTFTRDILPSYRPAVLRGLVKDWPSVRAASLSAEEAARHVASFYRGAEVEAFVGRPEIGGRFFYSSDMSGFNFQKQKARLTDVLGYLVSEGQKDDSAAVYVGAASVPECLPGFDAANPLPLLAGKPAIPRIWIGNRTSVSTHFDLSDNVACVVSGRRRFILFPPDQLPNLYVGPLDHTMAGQPASMVPVHSPDFERFPKFREALDTAMIADLQPGDAIYVPTLWWHHVDALTPFNILVNYWWQNGPGDAGSPFEAMAHGIFAIGHLPEAEREAWRGMFDHYVFRRNGDPAEHLAPERRGILGASTPELRARMKQFLLRALSRR